MRFLRTKLATEFSRSRSIFQRLVEGAISLLGRNPNPDYAFDRVCEWLVEFDDGGVPAREVGLDAAGVPLFSGPDERNYGLWLDTNMRWRDFEGEEISGDVFENAWQRMSARGHS